MKIRPNLKIIVSDNELEIKEAKETIQLNENSVSKLFKDFEFSNDYKVIKELGSGVGGTVSLVLNKKSGKQMAKKSILIDYSDRENVRKTLLELNTLEQCKSEFIIDFYGAFSLDNEKFYLTDFMNIGSFDLVNKLMNRVPERMLAKIAFSVIKGLDYLFKTQKIIHRDLKPSNILLNTLAQVKICDFGVSGEVSDKPTPSTEDFVGTLAYMSPERLSGSRILTTQNDIWSLGITLAELAIGKYPIPNLKQNMLRNLFRKDPKALMPRFYVHKNFDIPIFAFMELVINGKSPSLSPKYFSKDVTNFTRTCLKKIPSQRLDYENLLEHPFLKRVERDAEENLSWALNVERIKLLNESN